MSGVLLHSPGDIVRRALIAIGQGLDPPSTPWPIYADAEPNSPDNVITVYGTSGNMDGRMMADGSWVVHHGIQVRIRSATPTAGFVKANAIAVAMDQSIYQQGITISGTSYLVHSISRKGEVIPLGKEEPGSKRNVFTINAVVVIKKVN